MISVDDNKIIIFYGTFRSKKTLTINLSDIVHVKLTYIEKASFTTNTVSTHAPTLEIILSNELKFKNKNDEAYYKKGVPLIYTFQVSTDLKKIYLLSRPSCGFSFLEKKIKEKLNSESAPAF